MVSVDTTPPRIRPEAGFSPEIVRPVCPDNTGTGNGPENRLWGLGTEDKKCESWR